MEETRDIAIVGMGGIFPEASGIRELWGHVLAGRSLAREVAPGRWPLRAEDVYARGLMPDRAYSTRACFIDGFACHPEGLAIDAGLLARLDPMFHLLLHAGREAWRSAATARIDRRRAGIIIGNIALPTDGASALTEAVLGELFEARLFGEAVSGRQDVEWLNRYVAGLPAGLLAKALGLGGGTLTLDAACASSLYAVKLAAEELRAGRADVMLTGGLSRPDSLYTQMGFSQLHALSPSGRCAPFDARADGLVVGEGAGILVLKRTADALRDGDRIYATIAGIGLSNDIAGNLMQPDSGGQLRAMRAAYARAGWRPGDVELIECHGTGTPVGDGVEVKSLLALRAGGGEFGRTVIGSVKSNVGHLLTAAGAAGLIKVLTAMEEGVLPPTANFEGAAAGSGLEGSSYAVLRQAEAWERRGRGRRAAVSGFGFGGINAHVLVEEWEGAPRTAVSMHMPERREAGAVAIVGMGAQFGPWKELGAFARRVIGGEPAQATAPRGWWGDPAAERFRGFFVEDVAVPLGRFRIPPAELADMLPQQLLMLQVAADAFEDARIGHVAAGEERLETGVFIGIGLDLNTTNFRFRWTMLEKARTWARERGMAAEGEDFAAWVEGLRESAGPALNANRTMGALGGIVASRVARAFHVGGPSFTISSEESSGLRALEMAVRALQRGELRVALAGAVDLAGDLRAVLGQDAGRPYSGSGVARPFDEGADGAVIGEGAAAVVLKRYADAVRDGDRIYAVIRGVGAASGQAGEGAVPTAEAYAEAWRRARAEAGPGAAGVEYLEGHGSGDPAEDAMEAAAIARLLAEGANDVAIGSVKGEIGHAGAAAGLAGVVKAALCLSNRVVPGARGSRELVGPLTGKVFAPLGAQYWLHDRAAGRGGRG